MARQSVRIGWLLFLVTGAWGQAVPGVWLDVPFVAQPRDGCGAASLSMLMQYWAAQEHRIPSADSDVTAIQGSIYSPRDHGIKASAMADYLRAHGYQAFAFNGTWSDLEQHLRKGRPLIVAVRPQGQADLHYVVIDGIDSQRALVTMNDPGQRKLLTEDKSAFKKDWRATHNWLLLAVPAPSAR